MLVCPPKFSEFSQRSRNNNYDFFDWNFWDVWRTNSNFGGGWICCRARALRARSSFFVLNVQNATRSSSLIDFRRCQQELYFFSLIQRLLRPTKFLKSSLDFTILLRSFAIRLSANSRINPRLKVSMLSKIDSGTALRVRVAYGAEPSPRFLQFWTSDSSLGSFCNIEKRVWVVACISMIGENFFMLAIVHNWRIFSAHALFYCAFFLASKEWIITPQTLIRSLSNAKVFPAINSSHYSHFEVHSAVARALKRAPQSRLNFKTKSTKFFYEPFSEQRVLCFKTIKLHDPHYQKNSSIFYFIPSLHSLAPASPLQ